MNLCTRSVLYLFLWSHSIFTVYDYMYLDCKYFLYLFFKKQIHDVMVVKVLNAIKASK